MSTALLDRIVEAQERGIGVRRCGSVGAGTGVWEHGSVGEGAAPSLPDSATPIPPHSPTPIPPHSATPVPAAADAAAENLLENDQVRRWIAGRTPSHRNREVFRAVVAFGRHQREVAAAFGITQPRVNQILKQVGAWLGRVVAQRDQALTPAEQLQATENVTRMQYDAVYDTAMQLLRASEESTTVEKCRKDAEGKVVWSETTTRQNRANASFLGHALRSVSERAKFEGIYGKVGGDVVECGGVGARECGGEADSSHTHTPPHSPTPAPADPYKPLSREAADKPSAETAPRYVNVRIQTPCGDSQPPEKPASGQPANSYRPEARASSPAVSDEEYAQLMAIADEQFEKYRDEADEVKEPGPLSREEAAADVETIGDDLQQYVVLAVDRVLKDEPREMQAAASPSLSAFSARLFLRQCGFGIPAADQLMRLFDPQSQRLLPPGEVGRVKLASASADPP